MFTRGSLEGRTCPVLTSRRVRLMSWRSLPKLSAYLRNLSRSLSNGFRTSLPQSNSSCLAKVQFLWSRPSFRYRNLEKQSEKPGCYGVGAPESQKVRASELVTADQRNQFLCRNSTQKALCTSSYLDPSGHKTANRRHRRCSFRRDMRCVSSPTGTGLLHDSICRHRPYDGSENGKGRELPLQSSKTRRHMVARCRAWRHKRDLRSGSLQTRYYAGDDGTRIRAEPGPP